jgi:Uma2 family endonuclease
MGNLSTPQPLALRWTEIERDAALRDLPYKIELNLWGKIEMSPASFWRGRLQGEIATQLGRQLHNGAVLTEIPVLTDIGVRVPDVAWGSKEYLDANGDASPATRAPEICIEVISPSNSDDEIREKIRAYLAAGAREVWIVLEEGGTQYFDSSGERTESNYPVRVALPKRSGKT